MKRGERVGKYVLERRIAAGGMAEVWAGERVGPGPFRKPVALKFILPHHSDDPTHERLFVAEAMTAARLRHGNLVGVIDFDRLDDDGGGADAADDTGDGEGGATPARGRYFLVMERVEGADLAQLIAALRQRGEPLPCSLAVSIVAEVLEGLRYLHGVELVHRDVSPHNVLLSYDGEVKLSDFGIAESRTGAITADLRLRGKLPYLAPELLRGVRASHLSDQFSAGVMLWELLAGRALFDGSHEAELLEAIRVCEIPPLPPPAGTSARTRLCRALTAVCRRMLARDPADRFPTTLEALQALHALNVDWRGRAVALRELMHRLFPGEGVAAAGGAGEPRGREATTRLSPAATVHDGAAPSSSSSRQKHRVRREHGLSLAGYRRTGRLLGDLGDLGDVGDLGAGVDLGLDLDLDLPPASAAHGAHGALSPAGSASPGRGSGGPGSTRVWLGLSVVGLLAYLFYDARGSLRSSRSSRSSRPLRPAARTRASA